MSKKIIEDIYNSKYSSLQEDINKILAKKANFVLESLKQHVGQNYFVVERTMQELDDPEDETRGGKASGTPAAAPSPTQPARAAPTGRGNYPVYPKSSPEAGSFRDAFAKARRAGETEFEFQGRKYNTRRADDPPSAGGRQPQPAQPRQQQQPAQPRQQQQPAQPNVLDRIERQAAEVGREQARQNAERAARAQRFAAAQPDPARREPPAAPPRPQPSPGVSDNEAERLQQSRADAASRRAAELRALRASEGEAQDSGVGLENTARERAAARSAQANRERAAREAEREREERDAAAVTARGTGAAAQKEIDDRTMS